MKQGVEDASIQKAKARSSGLLATLEVLYPSRIPLRTYSQFPTTFVNPIVSGRTTEINIQASRQFGGVPKFQQSLGRLSRFSLRVRDSLPLHKLGVVAPYQRSEA